MTAGPLLAMSGVEKSFPGVHALRGVDLRLEAGEVLALLGENGAGKSTLVRILGGAVRPDAGTIAIAGRTMLFHSPSAARAAGVAVMHQELAIVPGLTAVENIFLGQEDARTGSPGPVRLEIANLTRLPAVRDVSFTVRRGEILAITGLVGAGRTETVRLVFGADIPDSGTIRLDGRRLSIRSPRDAIAAGIGLLTEDRKLQGLVLDHSVRANFGLPNLARFSRRGFVDAVREREACGRAIDRLRIRTPGQEQAAGGLSGGNQQKLVLAKWLARDCEVLTFDEPTRGVDVGARYEIYLLMRELAAAGKALIMVSSDLPEVLGMADRILVMHDGRVTGVIDDVPGTAPARVMELAHA